MLNNTNLRNTAVAFRGYNVTNLGRTPELLAHPAYGPTLRKHLQQASELCEEVLGRSVDLCQRVTDRHELGLDAYCESIAMVAAAELAQVELAAEMHGLDLKQANCAFGYSLGELIAASMAGVCEPLDVLRIPLELATDCAELAADTSMGILFSRGAAIDAQAVTALCEGITCQGEGTLAPSAILSPNTMLLLGQGETIERFKERASEALQQRVSLRVNDHRWPPLHTAIVRQRNVPDRAAVMIERVPLHPEAPSLPILSLVTGKPAYADGHTRALLRDWVDHPQQLWDVVGLVLARNVNRMIHVGPAPNVIPATFQRLAENVRQTTSEWSLGGIGLRAVQQIANRPWLAAILPQQGHLLRAPAIEHVVLEEWLLENEP